MHSAPSKRSVAQLPVGPASGSILVSTSPSTNSSKPLPSLLSTVPAAAPAVLTVHLYSLVNGAVSYTLHPVKTTLPFSDSFSTGSRKTSLSVKLVQVTAILSPPTSPSSVKCVLSILPVSCAFKFVAVVLAAFNINHDSVAPCAAPADIAIMPSTTAQRPSSPSFVRIIR